jgi:hypothetical protein
MQRKLDFNFLSVPLWFFGFWLRLALLWALRVSAVNLPVPSINRWQVV